MIKISSIAILIGLLAACSPKVVLQTDNDNSIDLSGRWNQTDAAIIESILFNQLMQSVWIKNYQFENSFKPKIFVNEFQTNFENEVAGKYLQELFEKSIETNHLLELLATKDSTAYDHLIFSGVLRADEFIEFEERKAIYYRLAAQLKDRSGIILWEGTEEIKKYINE